MVIVATYGDFHRGRERDLGINNAAIRGQTLLMVPRKTYTPHWWR